MKIYNRYDGGPLNNDIELGALSVETTNYRMRENTALGMTFRNIADTAEVPIYCSHTRVSTAYEQNADGMTFNGWNADNGYFRIMTRDNGVGLLETMRYIGAADPYIGITGVMATIPTNANLPVGFWTIGYVSGGNATLYVNDAGTIKSLVLGAPA